MESVRFKCDEDGLSNFPSEPTFRMFKKQRDLFYNMLRQSNRQTEESEFKDERPPDKRSSSSSQQHWGYDLQALVTMQKHPVNQAHLARLFRDQMLKTCVTELLNAPVSSSSSLKADPVKLCKLEARINANSASESASRFTRAQVFFKNFVKTCDSCSFLSHLKNALVETIIIKNSEASGFSFEGDFIQLI